MKDIKKKILGRIENDLAEIEKAGLGRNRKNTEKRIPRKCMPRGFQSHGVHCDVYIVP